MSQPLHNDLVQNAIVAAKSLCECPTCGRVHRPLSPEPASAAAEPDLALIEATARKLNPGRDEDHIKSVALDALSIFRALQSRATP